MAEPAHCGRSAGRAAPPAAADGSTGDCAPRRLREPRLPVSVRVRRAPAALDSPPDARDTPPMDDPLVAALAQLVRDRWSAERRERAAVRARLRVVEGTRHATRSGHR